MSASPVPSIDSLQFAHVRVLPPPEYIDSTGRRRVVGPEDAVGVCKVELPEWPARVRLCVPLDGTYTIDVPREAISLAGALDETVGGYHLRAQLNLVGCKVVVDPRRTVNGSHIWLEPV